jgi:hypothetical protein
MLHLEELNAEVHKSDWMLNIVELFSSRCCEKALTEESKVRDAKCGAELE